MASADAAAAHAAEDRAQLSYLPGDWLGIVRGGTVVLLPPDTGRSLVEPLWALLGRSPEIHEVLDAVTAASGGSLFRLPWFGVVGLAAPLRVFLRGEIDLTVRLDGGTTTELSGRDVTTWTERRLPAAENFEAVLPAAGGDSAAAATATAAAERLPLAEGVVMLRGLVCALDGGTPGTMQTPAAAAPAAAAPRDEVLLAAAAADVEAELADEADEAADVTDDRIEAESGDAGSSADTVLELPEDLAPAESEAADAAAAASEPADAAAAGQDVPEAPEPAEAEPTSSYDHLWERTVLRTIEDAAVREDPDADGEPATAAAEPAAEPEPAPEPEPVFAPEPEPAPAPAPAPPAVPGGLIDSVPWATGGDRAAAAPAPAPATAPTPRAQQGPPSLIHAFARPDTAPESPASASLAQPAAGDTDHDGQTIMKSALPGRGAAPLQSPPEPAPGTGPMVLARVCPQGHANPPTSAACAYCGQALPGDGVQVRRPRLGRVRLSTGELIDLDQSLIIGRQPSVSRVQGAVMPRLIQVASPGGDISRSHVEVRLEGWHVMLCDLKATNGTVLLREGQAPRRLAQGEMAIVFDGDIAELGDGIQLRFEELL
ncbi:FHA domain-containing protein [Arthrobacter sp. NPDC080082]|uniref:FHA domain-containing protein n=1 Tax=Arthrobacter sp. NPDC080082 TaxID=3155916 RepID=UPI003438AD02